MIRMVAMMLPLMSLPRIEMEKIMTTVKSASKRKTWAVQNVKTGKIAKTKESNYNRLALFETRESARAALKTGKVFARPELGKVIKRTLKK